MKISWNCLKELIDLKNMTPLDIAQELTLGGFEVESITSSTDNQDTILKINITANRQDIEGLIDIATEISALSKKPLKFNHNKTCFETNTVIEKILKDEDSIKSIESYLWIRNIHLQYTSQRIKNYLINMGKQPASNVLDIINFINLKWGQKIFAYGLSNKNQADESSNNHISITCSSKSDPEIYINNKILIQLNSDNIQKDNKTPKNILIINYKAGEEYSNYSLHAYQELFSILSEIHNKKIIPAKVFKHNEQPKYKQKVTWNINRINKILGPTVGADQKQKFLSNTAIVNILHKLHFNAKITRNQINIVVPTKREKEIDNSADIAEEVGRIYGFNNFLDQLPTFQQKAQPSKTGFTIKKIRRILRSMGLHEVINHSMQREKDIKNCLEIINPLSKEQKILRTNITEYLFENKLQNINQNNTRFEVFEVGKVFHKKKTDKQYSESMHLSCLVGHNQFNQSEWKEAGSKLSWFQAKGGAEELLERIRAQVSWSAKKQDNYLAEALSEYIHPVNSLYIIKDNQVIGVFSQLNKLTTKTIKNVVNTYFLEININQLTDTIKSHSHFQYRFKPYSSYPKITRDFSIKINTHISMSQIIQATNKIKKQEKYLIESVKLQSEYYNDKTSKTVCLRVTYRSQKKTLTHKEIEILDNIFKSALFNNLESKA